jgi:amino acid transporter
MSTIASLDPGAGDGGRGVPAIRRLRHLKRLLVGRPLRSDALDGRRLAKWLALPIFSSDPLSSVAYATEAALVVIVSASAVHRAIVFPITVAIAALLAVVALSYTRIVREYSSSGGAYVVARENLGTLPALVAGAALFVDYVLTVAVSVAAGTLALASAVPELGGVQLELALGFVGALALANLRGVREAGTSRT